MYYIGINLLHSGAVAAMEILHREWKKCDWSVWADYILSLMFLMLVETLKCVQKLPRSKLRFMFFLHCYSLQFCQQTKDLNMTAHVGCISQDLILTVACLTLVLVFYRPLNKWRKMNEEIQNELKSSWSSVGIALHSSQIPGKCGHECFFPVDVL